MTSPTSPTSPAGKSSVPSVFNPPDPSEGSGKKVAKVGAFLSKGGRKKQVLSAQDKAFSAAYRMANLTQKTRRTRIEDQQLKRTAEVIGLQEGIGEEEDQRKKRQEAVLLGSKAVQVVAIKNVLSTSAQQTDKAMEYLNLGFNIANQIVQSGKEIQTFLRGDIQKSPEFKEAWKNIEDKMDVGEDRHLLVSVKEEFSFFVGLSAQCVSLDIEIENLSILKKLIVEQKNDLAVAKNNGSETDAFKIKQEIAHLRYQEKGVQRKVKELKKNLKLAGLHAVTLQGAKYSTALIRLMKSGSSARAVLSQVAKYLPLIGSALALSLAIKDLVKSGKKIHATEKKIKDLENAKQKTPAQLNDLTKMLINNTLSYKIMHLNKSHARLKAEAAFAMLRAVVASVQLSQASIACLAIICGVVIATPGLNTTALVLGILLVVGIQGVAVFNKIKHERKGMRLEIQHTEETKKIFALSGRFHTKGIAYQQMKEEIGLLAREEGAWEASLKELESKKGEYPPKQFAAIKGYLEAHLEPIKSLRKQFENLEEELLLISKELDQLVLTKNQLEAHLGIENLARDFNLQEFDLLEMEKIFRKTLEESPEVTKEFVRFLTEKGVPITSEEDIFASVLRFIRSDEEVLEPEPETEQEIIKEAEQDIIETETGG